MPVVLRVLGQDRLGEHKGVSAHRARPTTRCRAIAQGLHPAAGVKPAPFPDRADVGAQAGVNIFGLLSVQRS